MRKPATLLAVVLCTVTATACSAGLSRGSEHAQLAGGSRCGGGADVRDLLDGQPLSGVPGASSVPLVPGQERRVGLKLMSSGSWVVTRARLDILTAIKPEPVQSLDPDNMPPPSAERVAIGTAPYVRRAEAKDWSGDGAGIEVTFDGRTVAGDRLPPGRYPAYAVVTSRSEQRGCQHTSVHDIATFVIA